MKKIKEIIVVEGKDDISRVKSAFECDVITTNGTHFSKDLIKKLKEAQKNCGIIVFTDPDYAGEKIRRFINSKIPNCKNAFINRELANKDGNIGVENASREAIIDAIENAKVTVTNSVNEITNEDIVLLGLNGNPNSKVLREKCCDILNIGYCNSKQFLKRVNSFGITREKLLETVEKAKEL